MGCSEALARLMICASRRTAKYTSAGAQINTGPIGPFANIPMALTP